MKTNVFFFFIYALAAPFLALGQVGIGTITPNASLDIKSSNQATPVNTDGLLIPRIDEFPVTPPTAAQDGMLVYATGAGSVARDFYHWDNSGSQWLAVDKEDSIDRLSDGKYIGGSVFLGYLSGANDDGSTNRNVGVGEESLLQNVDGFSNVAVGYQSLYANTDGVFNTALGYHAMRNNSNGNGNVAVGTSAGLNLLGNYNTFIGYRAGLGDTANTMAGSIFIGSYAGENEAQSNRLYIENSDSASPLIYGEFDTDKLRINGEFQIGNPTATGYTLPLARGSANQVIKTDASGNLSWVNVTSFGSEKIDDLTDGKTNTASNSIYLGVNAGTATTDTNTGNIGMGRNALTLLTNGNNNVAIGDLSLDKLTSGDSNVALGNYAMTNKMSGDLNTAVGSHSQFQNSSGTENSSLGYRALYGNSGNYNTGIGAHAGHGSSGNSNVFIGYRAAYSESGNNKLYIENSDADANNALVYGEFDTNLFRINGILNINSAFSFPIVDGTSNQVLQTNGSGNLSWVDPSTLDDEDWNTVGSDIERSSGNVYIGDTNTTDNDLYLSDRLIDWDDTSYYINPSQESRLNKVQFDNGVESSPTITFEDLRTGFWRPAIDEFAYSTNQVEQLRISANGNLGIKTNNPEDALEVNGSVMLEDSTGPTARLGHSGLYSRSGELNAVDESGNITVISPHHFSLIEPSDPMAWSFYSKNEKLNQQVNVDMMRVVELVENLTGEQLIFKADLDGNILPSDEKENLYRLIFEQQEQIDQLEKMVQVLLNKK